MAGNSGEQKGVGGVQGGESVQIKIEASAPSTVPDSVFVFNLDDFPLIPLPQRVRRRRVRTLRAGGDAAPAAAGAPPATVSSSGGDVAPAAAGAPPTPNLILDVMPVATTDPPLSTLNGAAASAAFEASSAVADAPPQLDDRLQLVLLPAEMMLQLKMGVAEGGSAAGDVLPSRVYLLRLILPALARVGAGVWPIFHNLTFRQWVEVVVWSLIISFPLSEGGGEWHLLLLTTIIIGREGPSGLPLRLGTTRGRSDPSRSVLLRGAAMHPVKSNGMCSATSQTASVPRGPLQVLVGPT